MPLNTPARQMVYRDQYPCHGGGSRSSPPLESVQGTLRQEFTQRLDSYVSAVQELIDQRLDCKLNIHVFQEQMRTFIQQANLLSEAKGMRKVDSLPMETESTGTSSSAESSMKKKKKAKHATPPRAGSPQMGGARPRISSPSPKRHDQSEAGSRPSRPRLRGQQA